MTTTQQSPVDTYSPSDEQYRPIGETTPDKEGMVRQVFKVSDIPVAFYSQDDERSTHEGGELDATPVTASPLGLAEAAIHLGELAPDSRAARLYESIRAENYNEDVLLYLDQLNAAVSYDDVHDRRNHEVQDAGFAVMLAALEGDESAQKIVDERLKKFQADYAAVRLEATHGATPEEHAEALKYLEGLAIVHSTKYDVRRNDDGSVMLSSLGDHRRRDANGANRYPRATVHFTLNGEVTAHAFNDEWGEANTLIVANLGRTVAAGRLPYSMNTIDTAFDLNPGEQLTLPDAIVIRPQTDMQGVYEQSGNTITYKYVEHYTDEDRQAFAEQLKLGKYHVGEFSDEEIATRLRDYALAQAIAQNGVTTGVLNIESESSNSVEIDSNVRDAALVLGTEIGLHADQPNGDAEERMKQRAEHHVKGPLRRYTINVPINVSLAAQRMYIANGYLAPGSQIPAQQLQAIRDSEGSGV